MNAYIRSIQVPRNSKYVNLGIVVNDDLYMFRIYFMSNIHKWGIAVEDPDGNFTTAFSDNGVSMEDFEVDFDDHVIRIDIYNDSELDTYEIYMVEVA